MGIRYLTYFLVLLISQSAAAVQHTVGVAGGIRGFDYHEDLTAPLKSEQSGFIPDAKLFAEQRTLNRHWIAVEKVEFAWGALDYNGSTQPPNPVPVTSTNDHSFWVFEGAVGRKLFSLFARKRDLYLYVGLNFRIWNRSLGNPNEVYTLLTLPVGLRLEPEQIHPLQLSCDLSIRPLVSGNVGVTYAASTGYDPQNIPVDPAIGFRAEFPFRLLGHGKAGLNVTPWFEFSQISAGGTVPVESGGQPVQQNGQALSAMEPSSETYQYGAFLSLDLTF